VGSWPPPSLSSRPVLPPLRIVQVNLAYDEALRTPASLLAAYHTLTGWAEAVRHAGADVVTVQRFASDADVTHAGGRFVFVFDGGPGLPGAWEECAHVIDAVLALDPDLVHINGLMFPGVARTLRQRLPRRAAIVLQDHSGVVPRVWPWPIDRAITARWRHVFALVDACVLTASGLAERWHRVGLPRETTILELPPAGSSVRPRPRDEAVRDTGMRASPAILWVGRLDANKDPLTVLEALEMAMPRLPDARCWVIHGDAPLEAAVRRRLADSVTLHDRVTIVGAVPHERIAAWFSAADIFVSGSHHEGSGYSLIEAMACGVMPCVTGIPSFRALTDGHGALWTAGDADACAAALLDLAARNRETEREAILRRYTVALSWESIGTRTVRAYRELASRRRSAVAR